jgi:hypothetical protein
MPTLTMSLRYVCIMQMRSCQNICTDVQYNIYEVAKAAQVCDKSHFIIATLRLSVVKILKLSLVKTCLVQVFNFFNLSHFKSYFVC